MLEDGRESDNIEDRRGEAGVGGGGFPIGGRHVGIGAIVVAVAASYFFGIDPRVVLGLMSGGSPAGQAPVVEQSRPAAAPPQDELGHFVGVVLAKTEDTWTAIFRQQGLQYRMPKLVLFSGSTPTACGTGRTAAGPFYCPNDEKVYIDLEFYRMLRDRFKAPGDFAQAYVIAHEVGHHVQKLLGTMAKTDALRERMTDAQYNQVSVRLELQADCYAGVWAHDSDQMHKFLEAGDLDSALRAATAIGDDTLQKQAQGYAVPETFTHGTSAQRVRWFRSGFDNGTLQACDTFSGQI
ncbi:MAG TPA: neutral zinc metallopeptidase [Burkholderiaceae bacterium]|nr:neutral zinc metallopeptidase [Burkholderiaceae bacterium]